MPNSATSALFPLLKNSLERAFNKTEAESILKSTAAGLLQDFDLDSYFLLRRHLALYLAETGDTLAAGYIEEQLRRDMEASFARDPSDLDLLYALALKNLESGETGIACRRLRKVARSGYSSHARAQATLSEMAVGAPGALGAQGAPGALGKP